MTQKSPTFTHHFDGFFIDQSSILVVQCAVKSNTIALIEQILQIIHPNDPKRTLNSIGQVWVIESNPEAEGKGAQGHSGSDTT